VAKTSTITARIDAELKADVQHVFAELGLTSAQAITLFFRLVKLNQGLPFAVKIPTSETLKAFEDVEHGRELVSFDTAEDLYKDLGI
jgi:DNA-damage-inducible protein J